MCIVSHNRLASMRIDSYFRRQQRIRERDMVYHCWDDGVANVYCQSQLDLQRAHQNILSAAIGSELLPTISIVGHNIIRIATTNVYR